MKTTELMAILMRLGSRFSRFYTIRDRVLVIFGFLVLLPVVVVSARSSVASWHNGQAQVIYQLESVATLKEAEIERWLASLQMSLTAVLSSHEAYILAQTLTKGPTENAIVQEDWANIIRYAGLFEELFLMDTSGQVVLSNGPTAVGTIHLNQAYFQQGRQGIFVNPPAYSPTLSRMSIVIALPVLDEQGQSLGVLAGRVSMATLNEIMLERTGLGTTGETYLIGANHALLTNVLLVEANVQTAKTTLFVRNMAAKQATAGQPGSGLYDNYHEEPVIGVYRWLPSLQVALLAEQNQAEAFASLKNALVLNIITTLLALITTIIVAYYVANSRTKPLHNLTVTAQQIANGQYNQMADVTRADELGTLAQAFNSMTGRLSHLIADLERHVWELELSQLALQASEDRYRALYNSSPIMMHSANASGKMTNVNLYWLETMGYRREEVIGRFVIEFMTTESVQYAQNQIAPLFFAQGEVKDIAYQFVKKGGQIIDVLATSTAQYGANGEFSYSLTAVQDITERKKIERQLRQNEERSQALINAIPDMMFRVNIEGVLLDFKADQSESVMPAAEIIGTRFADTPMPQSVVQDILRLVQRSVLTGEVETYEYELPMPNGRQLYETRMIKSGLDEAVCLVRNITARKRTEETLQQSEANLREAQELAHLGNFEFRLPTQEVFWSDEVYRIFGVPVGEAVSLERYQSLLPAGDFDQVMTAVSETIATYKPYYIEHDIILASGERKHAYAIGRPLWDETTGEVTSIFGTVQDITERKQSEAHILASLQEKEVLLKEIHHRVKNNLQVISSLLDLQADYIDDEVIQSVLQDSRSRVRSMALVHEQLYQAADLARIDFADYVERLTGFLLRAYGRQAGQITLQLEVVPMLLSVETAVPLGLIINELVSNAYKHGFVDGRSGEILIQLLADKWPTLHLIVQDNGKGISAELDFQRASSLGFTIVLTLVEQINGRIELNREQGTCFEIIFTLPIVETPPKAELSL